MKIQIWSLIVGLLLFYLIKKGADEAKKENKTVNVFEALMNGFQHTFDTAPGSVAATKSGIIDEDDDGYDDYRPSNDKMVSFNRLTSSFPNSKVRRKRGMFYAYSILKDIQAN